MDAGWDHRFPTQQALVVKTCGCMNRETTRVRAGWWLRFPTQHERESMTVSVGWCLCFPTRQRKRGSDDSLLGCPLLGAPRGDERGWDFSFRPDHPRTPGTAARQGSGTPPSIESSAPAEMFLFCSLSTDNRGQTSPLHGLELRRHATNQRDNAQRRASQHMLTMGHRRDGPLQAQDRTSGRQAMWRRCNTVAHVP